MNRMIHHPPQHRLRSTLKWWLAFILFCLTFAGMEWSAKSAGVRSAMIESDREQRTSELLQQLYRYTDRELTDLEADINGGKPLPAEHFDGPNGRSDRAVFDASLIGPRYKGWIVDFEFHPDRSIRSHLLATPPRLHNQDLRDWLGSAEIQTTVERFRQAMLIVCGVAWATLAMLISVAGPYRKRLAQMMIAAALLAMLGWFADPARVELWSVPPLGWIPCAALSGLLIGLLLLLLPVRSRIVRLDRCGACGYDLTGNESGICPECGQFTPVELRRRHEAELAQLANAIECTTLAATSPEIAFDVAQ
jgi:hypothetical protein